MQFSINGLLFNIIYAYPLNKIYLMAAVLIKNIFLFDKYSEYKNSYNIITIYFFNIWIIKKKLKMEYMLKIIY